MNDEGEWKEILLDDAFPCIENGGPAFSRASGNVI